MGETSKNIIFLEYSPNSAGGLSFVASLAGSRITWARDELEAINWAALLAGCDERVDLVLIDAIDNEQNLERALALFSQYALAAPVLIVDRFADASNIESMILRYPGRFPVKLCAPETIMSEKWL